jgi:hypothetical protein
MDKPLLAFLASKKINDLPLKRLFEQVQILQHPHVVQLDKPPRSLHLQVFIFPQLLIAREIRVYASFVRGTVN